MEYINLIGKDFKIVQHEYDRENNIIGAQCSSKEYPDRIYFGENKFQSYQMNMLTLACLNNIFNKEELMILYQMINCTDNCEYGTYFTKYDKYDYGIKRIILPCNIYELSDYISVDYMIVKKIVDILIKNNVLYELNYYKDRFHTVRDKCYFFDSRFINCSDGVWFNLENFKYDEDNVLLWIQSMAYDDEYNKDPIRFNQLCKEGWRGEKEYFCNGRNSSEYRKWLKDVTDRDKVCQCCGSNNNIDIHHINPYAKYKELRTDINNGIALCELHHSSMILGGFHQMYGTRNNTSEQLLEYIRNKRSELNITDKSFIKSPFLLEHINEI